MQSLNPLSIFNQTQSTKLWVRLNALLKHLPTMLDCYLMLVPLVGLMRFGYEWGGVALAKVGKLSSLLVIGLIKK